MQVIGADPEGSVYSGGTGRPYLVEGVGEDFWPDDLRPDGAATRSSRSPTATRSTMTRRLAREEGLLVGGSCGMAVVAALRVGRAAAGPDDVVVVLLPDCGRGYLSKVFNDEWMADYGFLSADVGQTVGDVLRGKTGAAAAAGAHPPERDARRGDRRSCASTASPRCPSYAPSRRSWRPRWPAPWSSGTCMEALFSGHAQAGRPGRGSTCPAPLPAGRRRRAGRAAVATLETADALLVLDDGKPVGVLTRQDLLGFLSH